MRKLLTATTAFTLLSMAAAAQLPPGTGGSGGGSPGGSSGQMQWNNGGAFAGLTVSGDSTIVTSTGVMTNTGINGVPVTTSLASGTDTITSTAAGSLTVGPNGATTPILQVDSSVASAVNGYSIQGKATGGIPIIQAIGTNPGVALFTGGNGNMYLGSATNAISINLEFSGATPLVFNTSGLTFSPSAFGSGANTHYTFNGASDTGLTAGANVPTTNFPGSTKTWAPGTVALYTGFNIGSDTLAASSASTVTEACTICLAGPPIKGSFTTAGTFEGIRVGALAIGSGTLGLGANISAPTGPTTAYAIQANGDINVSSGAVRMAASVIMSTTAPTVSTGFGTGDTIIASGTSGWQVTVGTSPASTGATFTMPTAAHGWSCSAHDVTTNTIVLDESATTTTSVSFKPYLRTTGAANAPTASDLINVACSGF